MPKKLKKIFIITRTKHWQRLKKEYADKFRVAFRMENGREKFMLLESVLRKPKRNGIQKIN